MSECVVVNHPTVPQIYAHAKSQLPGLEESISAGDFKPLKLWLNEHIHKLGSLPPSGDDLMLQVRTRVHAGACLCSTLLESAIQLYRATYVHPCRLQVTGSKLDPSVFLAYLKSKYSELYGL
jgi:Zn-dependent M32 family carboxypeptidase